MGGRRCINSLREYKHAAVWFATRNSAGGKKSHLKSIRCQSRGGWRPFSRLVLGKTQMQGCFLPFNDHILQHRQVLGTVIRAALASSDSLAYVICVLHTIFSRSVPSTLCCAWRHHELRPMMADASWMQTAHEA